MKTKTTSMAAALLLALTTATFAQTTGWFSDDTRETGFAGFTNTYPRGGNGSLELTTEDGTDKASFGYFWDPKSLGNPFGVVTTLGNLNTFTYEWYRDSASTSGAHLAPAIRYYFVIDLNGNGVYDSGVAGEHWGSLVYEHVYNSNLAAPVDLWQSVNVMSEELWQRAAGTGGAGNLDGTFGGIDGIMTLADWLNPSVSKPPGAWPIDANTLVNGISVSVGSGWSGESNMAVDNIAMGFSGGNTVVTNFAVPEPGSAALGLFGGIALIARRRRQVA